MPIVYILTNESMPNIIKIGITDNLERRVKELDNTSTPLPFECFYAVDVKDAASIEKKLHQGLDDCRVRQSREYFYSTPERAKSLLEIAEIMGGVNVTPTNEIVETLQDKQALEIAKNKKTRINYFSSLGIEAGTTLTFVKDKSITCEVVDERQVRFRGEVMTLSGSALIVIEEMGYDWGQVRGASFWCYKDKTLASLYEEI